ncbi:streptophobe family protein [Streptomyces sp. NPDC006367]|uniref:streptophobe family protein n=1 Tax=unclassified Streptomyces TaxID=2593676 RepID=UPI0033A27137
MGASTSVGDGGYGARVPWTDVVLSAVASVSWALIGMAGTAALGLRLLDADAAASLGPMTAAAVVLGAGGSVTPSGDVSAFGLEGAEAHTAVEITPLGVSLVGAVLLSFFFLRSLRAAGAVVAPAELLARAGAVTALFVAMLGGLARAGRDVVTIDGDALGLEDLPGGAGGGVGIPGLGDLGDLGDLGGALPGRVGDLVGAGAAVGFRVETAPTLLGGLVWCAGVLSVALLASRRTPLPRGWEAVHRAVRPAVSALVTVALTAVAAGYAAAAYAATGDDRPGRIAGAALLGAPNGVWLGVPVGLFVPWDGRATGGLVRFLPDPLDDLLSSGAGEPVTLGRLAELDGRVWLLGVAAALLMLLAGVLTAVRTPVTPADARRAGFTGRCALRLGVATAPALPLSAWLTEVSVGASLSVFGVDAFGAGIDLHGRLGAALLLGAVWGAGAGAAGALLARASGAAGRWATPLARGAAAGRRTEDAGPFPGAPGADTALSGAVRGGGPGGTGDGGAGSGGAGAAPAAFPHVPPGPYGPTAAPFRPPAPDTNTCLRTRGAPGGVAGAGSAGTGPEGSGPGGVRPEGAGPAGAGSSGLPGPSGPSSPPGPPGPPGPPVRWPSAGGRPPGAGEGENGPGGDGRRADGSDPGPDPAEPAPGRPLDDEDDLYGAPTVAGPPAPPRRPGRPSPRPGDRPRSRWGEAPPPPPPPPPRRPEDGG